MIIHLDGKAEELLEFVKGMQFPTTEGFCEAEKTEETDEETQAEVEREIEKLFTAAKRVAGASVNREEVTVELHWADLAALRQEANKRGLTSGELLENIVTHWLDKQKKARV